MVGRVLQAVYKEIRGLHEAAYVLALFTLASQLLALLRDRMLAHQFGAGNELDLYYAAFRIPDLMFVAFASVLSIYVLIPFVSERLSQGGKTYARALLSQVLTAFLLVYGFVALIAAIFAPVIVEWTFPGFSEGDAGALVLLMRIMLLQPFLLSLSNLLGVVTQLSERFVLYAISPILYNAGIIAGIIFFYPLLGLPGLVFGVVFGAFIHMIIQVPAIRESGLMPSLSFSFDRALFRRILATSLPRAATLSLHQFVLLVFAGIAAGMAAGSVSVFQFAFNLQSVPLAIIGVSYSVAAFPTLSRMFSNGERAAFIEYVGSALRHIFFWSLPAVALIVVIRAQIVRVILGSGAFNWDDTRLTAAALALFALSLAAQAANLLIVRAFYAGGDSKTPLSVTIFSSVFAVLTGSLLLFFFRTSLSFASWIETVLRVRDVAGTEVLMLPLGYAIALIVHLFILLALFMRRFALPWSYFGGSLIRGLFAAAGGGITAYIALNAIVYGIKDETFVGIFLQGFGAGCVGIAVIILMLYLLRSPELTEVYRALHRRIKKEDIVAPQQSDDAAVT